MLESEVSISEAGEGERREEGKAKRNWKLWIERPENFLGWD